MQKIHTFIGWRPADRWMIIKVYITLMIVELLCEFVPFNHIRKSIASKSKQDRVAEHDPLDVHRIVHAIEIASHYTLRKSTCLEKALTGYYLFTQNNIPVEFCIGVRLGLPGQMDAHAWIVYQGEVILGYLEDLPSYTKLTSPSLKVI